MDSQSLQCLLESGLLTDLLDGKIRGTNRDTFREILGLRPVSITKDSKKSRDPLERYPWLERKFHFTGISLVVEDEVSGLFGATSRNGVKKLEIHRLVAETSEKLETAAGEAMGKHNLSECDVLDNYGRTIGNIARFNECWEPDWKFELADARFLALFNFAETETVVIYEISK